MNLVPMSNFASVNGSIEETKQSSKPHIVVKEVLEEEEEEKLHKVQMVPPKQPI